MSDDLNQSYVAIHAPFYCRTASLCLTATENVTPDARLNMYMEAYESDPILGLWTVQQVETDGNDKALKTYSSNGDQNISFTAAIEKLSYFENSRLNPYDGDINRYQIAEPTPDKMKYKHYLAYAEREGLVFDKQAHAHVRPHKFALPPNVEIDSDDLSRADERWDGKSRDAHRSPVVALQTDLSGLFASAQSKVNPDEIVDRTVERRIEVLDRYLIHMETCYKNQERYVNEFKQLEKADLIAEASRALDNAESLIKKSFPGVEMPHSEYFLNFIREQRVYMLILHAQALQALNNERIYDTRSQVSEEKQYTTNSETIKKRLKEAETAFRPLALLKHEKVEKKGLFSKSKNDNINAVDRDVENMKRFALTRPPEASVILKALAKDYTRRRDEYIEQAKKGTRLRSNAIIPTVIQSQQGAFAKK